MSYFLDSAPKFIGLLSQEELFSITSFRFRISSLVPEIFTFLFVFKVWSYIKQPQIFGRLWSRILGLAL